MVNHDMNESVSKSILIVDDNPFNLQLLGKVLNGYGYEIEFAMNGEAALEWLNTAKFDLILLDINMPGMNGFEVCRKIRSNPLFNNMPVIFLSAESDRESILKGFELGAQDYLSKPFDSRELLVRVRTHLVLKDSLEKLEKLNKLLEEKVSERTQQLKEANDRLEATNLKLLDLDRAKSEFLNLISHEIRTPLNGIIGPLELLKDPVSISEIRELVEILNFSVKRLERFSLNALLITRLKTKQLEIRKDIINLSDLISEVIEEANEKLQSGNIQVKFENKRKDGIISGETELIKSCFNNILDNAIFFSPQNGIIEINMDFQDQILICEFKDEGKGFSNGAIDHIFEIFSTYHERRDNSSGLGLTLAKMIMEAHGGSIFIGNNQHRGASVKILFHNTESCAGVEHESQ
jgi:two-component system sensor histidine kinase/response regulator